MSDLFGLVQTLQRGKKSTVSQDELRAHPVENTSLPWGGGDGCCGGHTRGDSPGKNAPLRKRPCAGSLGCCSQRGSSGNWVILSPGTHAVPPRWPGAQNSLAHPTVLGEVMGGAVGFDVLRTTVTART